MELTERGKHRDSSNIIWSFIGSLPLLTPLKKNQPPLNIFLMCLGVCFFLWRSVCLHTITFWFPHAFVSLCHTICCLIIFHCRDSHALCSNPLNRLMSSYCRLFLFEKKHDKVTHTHTRAYFMYSMYIYVSFSFPVLSSLLLLLPMIHYSITSQLHSSICPIRPERQSGTVLSVICPCGGPVRGSPFWSQHTGGTVVYGLPK